MRAVRTTVLASVLATALVTALTVLAPRPWAPGAAAEESSVEIGTLTFPATAGYPDPTPFQIGTVRVSPATWLPGSRITVSITTSYPEKHCTTPEGKPRYAGHAWMRFSFAGVTAAAADMQPLPAPLTSGNQEPRAILDPDKAVIGWYRHTPGALYGEPALSPGVYRFSMIAPTGRDHFVVPDVEMFTEFYDPSPDANPPCSAFYRDVPMVATPLAEPAGSTMTVAAPTVAYGTKSQVTVQVSSDAGIPTGQVKVAGTGVSGVGTLKTVGSVARAVVALPGTLSVGKHNLTATYAGDGTVLGATRSVTVTVTKRKVPIALSITKKPTPRTSGTAKVRSSSPVAAKPGGNVVVVLTHAAMRRRVAGTMRDGLLTLTLPKLTSGAWKATATYAGDVHYAGASSLARRFTVAG